MTTNTAPAYYWHCGSCGTEIVTTDCPTTGVTSCPDPACDGGVDHAWHYSHVGDDE